MASVADRLAEVRARIEGTGHDADRITIVAVTKGLSSEACGSALGAGLVDLGENYGQELEAKALALPGAARWHMIGPVQRNKVRRLSPFVYLWQAVDRKEVGAAIAHHAPAARVLVQVNIAGRPGRSGCSWNATAPLVDELRALGLRVRGLMGVGDPDDPRPGFRRLAGQASELGLPVVSMGMSGDLETAVQEGSTMVRVGTALLGPRPGRDDLRR
jgi:pyridoxal phosphate enzyme (YggS family)